MYLVNRKLNELFIKRTYQCIVCYLQVVFVCICFVVVEEGSM